MTKTIKATVLAVALTASSVASVHGQGREPNMTEKQIANEMFVSTQSYPGSAGSFVGPQSAGVQGAFLVLGLITVIVMLGVLSPEHHYYAVSR